LGTRLTLQRVLLGSGVVGEKYLLTNIGNTTIELAETEFFKSSAPRPGAMCSMSGGAGKPDSPDLPRHTFAGQRRLQQHGEASAS
jgi:hypothetical protein